MAAGDPGVLQRNYSAIAVETTLTASISASSQGASGTIIVGSVAGYPSTAPYTLVLEPDTSREEVITVTAAAGTTLTVLRGQDNTQALAHSAGVSVRHAVSGRDFKETKTHEAAQTIMDLANQTHVHGIVTGEGVVVGTLKAQSLSNKTLVSPTITGTPGIATSIVFEGATEDAYETTLTVTDPTADRTITLPNATGTVVLDSLAQTLTSKTLTTATLGSNLDAGGYKITNLATPTLSSDAVRKDFADAQVAAAATSATSASNSASAAATSATSAAASATSAAASVATIASYASAAATSATSAATSASSAATSASSAAASTSAAAASATAAATSATSAAASATAAATSATSSLASQTAAATSATSAAASATAAATSATSAANSATSAANSVATIATYASNAATSATSAATSATSAAASATAAASSATDAATTYDNFDDRYLGSKSTAPTVDNDGNTLLVGAIYWNSTLNNMYVWSGSTWVQIATTSVYTAPTLGSQTIASGTTYTNIANLTINSTTIPSSKTLVVTTDKLSALAATTSAELAGVISDETGSGALVFANTPTINGPTITATGQTPVIHGILIPQSHSIFFEGTTDDAFETTFGVIDPTADRTINLPNTSGTVITTGNSSEALPSQTSNNGKYLTTDGSTASWAAAVTSVTSANTTRISVGGTAIAPTIDLSTSGVTATTYTLSTITVDAYGRITSASTGAAAGETFNPLLLMGA
jgi:hypothetical protein